MGTRPMPMFSHSQLRRLIIGIRWQLRSTERTTRRRGFRWLWFLWGGIALLVLLNGLRLLVGF